MRRFLIALSITLAISAVVLSIAAAIVRLVGSRAAAPLPVALAPARSEAPRATPQPPRVQTNAPALEDRPADDRPATRPSPRGPAPAIRNDARQLPPRRPPGNSANIKAPIVNPPVANPQPLVDVPTAREALSYVGADPQAEAVWVTAINDRNLPPNARKDLIEDLNEDGFDDPKHLTPDDIPLIINRMALIEQLAPAAMDDVNYAAFEEAYKDLQNMLRKVSGE
ncbi:MAG TPA: hypothetical protein VH370_20565 [Humisphaera sp.]|nr:hypothetical protein [Humisphaera sp.]